MFTGVNFEKAIDYYKKGKEVIVLDRNSLGKNEKSGYDTFSFSELGKNLDFLVDVPAVPNPEFEQAVQDMVEPDQNENDAEEKDRLCQWIPCSERLPENAMNVIAQFSSGTVTELRYAGNGIFEGIYDYSTKVIIAWMPLPEPYREEE